MTQKVALSGGIGSGKTTVRLMLEELGATTICADAIVHQVQAPGMPLLKEIAEAFGPGVIDPDGALDREALAKKVFSDPEARARLGRIMHPPVIGEMMRQAAVAEENNAPMVVLDIPLFFEGMKTGTGSAAATEYDAAVLVWVPAETQLERTVARDECAVEDAERRIAAQMSIDEKRQMATHVIDNSGDSGQTRQQVEALWQLLVGESND